jgi:hypothetical protein
VEDAEVFDGDIIEMGATTLEVQKADLRWSKTTDTSVQEWAPPPKPQTPTGLALEPNAGKMETLQKIPGATVPELKTPFNRRLAIGPQVLHLLETEDGREYLLEGSRVRFGSDVPPRVPEPDPEEPQAPKKGLPVFDAEYSFSNQNFSFYNLVLIYDEIVQSFKAVRIGPDSRIIRIFRKQSGLVWQTELPEGAEVPLMVEDHLQLGELVLAYRKREKE